MAFDLNRAANISTILVAICVLVATAVWILPGGAGARIGSNPTAPDTVRVADWEKYLIGGHVRGPRDAPVTILAFGDYECPFCARFEEEAGRILAAYPTQVRMVYRHWALPRHRFAYPAARAAECAADQGLFWPMHDLLYAMRDSLGLVSFDELAVRAGVRDAGAFEICVRRTDPVSVIDDGALHAKEAGGTGTPTVIVNGLLFRRGVDSAYVAQLVSARATP
jgi:protein-disulfide isomerase